MRAARILRQQAKLGKPVVFVRDRDTKPEN
jgi:hypothetical protein